MSINSHKGGCKTFLDDLISLGFFNNYYNNIFNIIIYYNNIFNIIMIYYNNNIFNMIYYYNNNIL